MDLAEKKRKIAEIELRQNVLLNNLKKLASKQAPKKSITALNRAMKCVSIAIEAAMLQSEKLKIASQTTPEFPLGGIQSL